MEVNIQLESFVMTKGLPKKSIMERLELELNDKFFIESKEKIYISNYNKIAGSCNVKTEKPFVFLMNAKEFHVLVSIIIILKRLYNLLMAHCLV